MSMTSGLVRAPENQVQSPMRDVIDTWLIDHARQLCVAGCLGFWAAIVALILIR